MDVTGAVLHKHVQVFMKGASQSSACPPIPVHVWTGPEGSRRLKLPDFKTVGT
jgi:hypothetical protein